MQRKHLTPRDLRADESFDVLGNLLETNPKRPRIEETTESVDEFVSRHFDFFMCLCLAFQPLPLQTLKAFLDEQAFSLRGLNVVSPLLQNIQLPPNERARCRIRELLEKIQGKLKQGLKKPLTFGAALAASTG